jgi:cyclophilin family peptidyl-prolyl cis-trans isomerase
MEVGGSDVGRITFELRADVAPKCAENFRALYVYGIILDVWKCELVLRMKMFVFSRRMMDM